MPLHRPHRGPEPRPSRPPQPHPQPLPRQGEVANIDCPKVPPFQRVISKVDINRKELHKIFARTALLCRRVCSRRHIDACIAMRIAWALSEIPEMQPEVSFRSARTLPVAATPF